ncbi:integrase family protein [Leptolyngbya boryana NIES-2135]|jgi:integrase|uniref:Integrase family protein n=1 Tax=Leptolyngbya boryana NIES-2135 TaxID=1973484 RepID=A0A1Z4JEN0_LEPBY|nr:MULTISPECIES: tyrosine-type recombinase/integrase [Leptolyngbya]BAY55209.1 integrase family protein [Leptolyngbya boryana NIES-2135]MBD2369296.1 tyrosine-type recombinase/integrase [Leptolyngbya sp. FACHB-161]MBD2375702.1 tyrosine-type recombinase/integrase [Leptolyngbya sp. FACHB-238]MBD2401051.1 tyrosine-type recombinase/integrase [Leptolyngbya sp. FACHB-239]MBD2406636.1 tyrosine-type recombinase/integrase [Leptolyngbya sp. FACHB-402]
MPRNSKGTVAIEKIGNRFRLRWRWDGKQETLAIGPATKSYEILAKKVAHQIEHDIFVGTYDRTKARYGKEQPKKSILDVWDEFTAARQMAHDVKYKNVRSHLSRWERTVVEDVDSLDAKNFLDEIGGKASTRRSYLNLLIACWEWLNVEENPWKTVKLPKAESPSPDPFSQEEVDKILKQFEGSYYLNFVKGLLGTGTRPNELTPVTWGDVRWQQRHLCIDKSWDNRRHQIKTTKTGKTRTVPLSEAMVKFLQKIKPQNTIEDDLIFPAPMGGYIDTDNFRERHWKPSLLAAGVRYRSTYKNRHSVWSHAIALGMPIAEAAKYAGNSPKTMVQHYLGSVSKSQMPDLLGGEDLE